MGTFDNLPPAPNTDNLTKTPGEPEIRFVPVPAKQEKDYTWFKVICVLVILASGWALFADYRQKASEKRTAAAREHLRQMQVDAEQAAAAAREQERQAARMSAANGAGFRVSDWTWENNGIINTYCRPYKVTVKNTTRFDATKLRLTLRAGATSVGVVLNGYLPAGSTKTFSKKDIAATRIARTCRDASLSVESAVLAAGG